MHAEVGCSLGKSIVVACGEPLRTDRQKFPRINIIRINGTEGRQVEPKVEIFGGDCNEVVSDTRSRSSCVRMSQWILTHRAIRRRLGGWYSPRSLWSGHSEGRHYPHAC